MRAALDNPDSTVVAINDPFLTLDYAAYQFKHDSVHGMYPDDVSIDEKDKCLVIGKVRVRFFSERNPAGKSSSMSLRDVGPAVVMQLQPFCEKSRFDSTRGSFLMTIIPFFLL